MKKLILILFALLAAREIRAFGLAGHAAIACIAEHHLTPRAKANIMRYTDHHSIVYYASWMDEWRHSKGYEFTTHWHAGTVDAQLRSTAAVRGLAVQFGAVSGRTDDSTRICTAGTGVSRARMRG